MFVNSDFSDLLKLFNAGRVRYLVIGGWARRVEIDFDGLPVPFISREDLITAKRASGRPQDMIDVESLLRTDDE